MIPNFVTKETCTALAGGALISSIIQYLVSEKFVSVPTGFNILKLFTPALAVGAVLFLIHVSKNMSTKNTSLSPTSIKPKKPNALNIVVVGAGLIGPRHAQHVKQNPSTNLFGIIDLNPKTRLLCEDMNTKYFSNVNEMVQYCSDHKVKLPDGAIICTPNHTHVPVAAELASHRINILVEKPVSPKPEDAKALKIYTNSKKVKVLVGHHRRFNPYMVAAKRNLSRLGKVIAIQGTWALKKHDEYFKIAPWRTDGATGGGALLINLVHDLDLLQYLLGPISQVYAEPLTTQREYHNVDEGASICLKFKSGVRGTFICSDNVPSPFNFESSTGENPTIPFHENVQGTYRIFGSEGTLSLPDFNLYKNNWITELETKTIVDVEKLRNRMPFDIQLDHFVEIINQNQVPNCSIDDGISASLVIAAAQKSLQTGLPQEVQDIIDIRPDFTSLKLDLDKDLVQAE